MPPVALEAFAQFRVARKRRGWLVDHDNVESLKLGLVQTKRLPHNALDAVTRRRLFAVFLRNREPQAGWQVVVRPPGEYGKAFVATSPGFFEDTAEGGAGQEPLVFLKSESAKRLHTCQRSRRARTVCLRRQASAAFGAAALDHETAGLGRHPGTETVGARALDFTGLESTFHRSKPG